MQARRQAYNDAITAQEVGQSPDVIAAMEAVRARVNAFFDQQLAACTG